MTPRLLLVFAVAASTATVAVSGPIAHAGTPCYEQVLDEWIDTEIVSATYDVSCYDEALKRAPDDLLLYSSFEDDVLAAKSKAVRQQASASKAPSPSAQAAPAATPPPPPPAAPPAADEAAPSIEPELTPDQLLDPIPEESLDELLTPIDPAAPPPVLEAPAPLEPLQPDVAEPSEAAPVVAVLRAVGPNDSRSVPVPLIVLTIVAGLLALGGAGVLGYRHYQARRYAESPPLPPRPPESYEP
ncbi:MAG: hypothetical protein ACE5EV_00520 [Gaiellales bacterium]